MITYNQTNKLRLFYILIFCAILVHMFFLWGVKVTLPKINVPATTRFFYMGTLLTDQEIGAQGLSHPEAPGVDVPGQFLNWVKQRSVVKPVYVEEHKGKGIGVPLRLKR